MTILHMPRTYPTVAQTTRPECDTIQIFLSAETSKETRLVSSATYCMIATSRRGVAFARAFSMRSASPVLRIHRLALQRSCRISPSDRGSFCPVCPRTISPPFPSVHQHRHVCTRADARQLRRYHPGQPCKFHRASIPHLEEIFNRDDGLRCSSVRLRQRWTPRYFSSQWRAPQ
jgi:hypothetical protein